MNDLQQAIGILCAAETQEALAREMDEKGFDYADCGCGWRETDYRCSEMQEYSLRIQEYEEELAHLLAEAMMGYEKALILIRKAAKVCNDEESWRLLARVLLDIDIHPRNANENQKELYWEAQYCFLHLYFATGKAEYLERAQMCEGFRHATICKVTE